MYRKIDNSKVAPAFNKKEVRRDALHYVRYRYIYADIRKAYAENRIDRHQFMTLYGQVRAGDAEGAEKGLRKLVYANV